MAKIANVRPGQDEPEDSGAGRVVPVSEAQGGRAGEAGKSQYSNEEVSEIIRIALRNVNGEDAAMVSQEELVMIGSEFGLEESDLTQAMRAIVRSREDRDRTAEAMAAFRLHAGCFAVVSAMLILIDWFSRPAGSSVWWAQYPTVSWGAVLALHYLTVRFNPELPALLVRKAIGLSKDLADNHRPVRAGRQRALFTIRELYGDMVKAEGLAQIQDDSLLLEFEMRETVFGVFKSGLREVSVPIGAIESIQFEKKMFNSCLTLIGRTFGDFKDVPGKNSGKIQLWFDRQATPAAEELALALADRVEV